MRIDVYDTYATSKKGHTIHFDVFLPHGNKQQNLRLQRANMVLLGFFP